MVNWSCVLGSYFFFVFGFDFGGGGGCSNADGSEVDVMDWSSFAFDALYTSCLFG